MAGKGRVTAKDVMDILGAWRSSGEQRDEACAVGVLVDPSAPRPVVEALRDALMPERPYSHVAVSALPSKPVPSWDAAIVLAGPDAAPARTAALLCAQAGVPACLVVETAVEAPSEDEAAEGVSYVAAATPDAATSGVAEWLVDACPKKATALAANFPFCRKPHVANLVRSCALENAAVGAVDLVPRADLPVMAVSQAKLALDIEAAHGKGSTLEGATDVALVMALALAYRSLARAASKAAPGLSWLVRGLMGAGGTWATGRLVELRVEGDVDLAQAAATAGRAAVGAVTGAVEAVRGATFDAAEAASKVRTLQLPLPLGQAPSGDDYLTLG